MISVFSGSCEAAGQEADAGDQAPGMGAGDGRLEVFGETAIASKPGEGAFDHPAFWFRLECADVLGSGDDLDCPAAECSESPECPVAPRSALQWSLPAHAASRL